MALYRGPGGSGDATADAANEAALVSTLVTQAQTAATNASNSANNANTSANSASTSASNAATSESNAASSASLASFTASLANSSASAAAASASAASTSATNAANSAQISSNFAVAASMSYDSFDDRYLGAKATAPTLDNDGDPILTGALYWDTATDEMFVWDGTQWVTLAGGAGAGTVTSVAMTVPTGLSVSGSPVTTTGTLAVTYASGYAIPTTAKQTEWDTAYSWGNHASAGYLTSETFTGTVTSVAMTVPTGLTVSGTPITSSGTFAVSLQSGYAIPTTVKQSNWDDSYTFVSNFPTQTGNSGKYLTTNGSTLSWGTVTVTETDPVVGAINGIVKANGSGTISAATAGTDYLAPAAIGTTVQAYDSNLTSFVTTFTLPTTDGTAGQILQTNGSGVLSFVTNTGGSGISMGKAIAAAIVFG